MPSTAQDFETLLKEVVSAKRLSASQTKQLTDMAVKLTGYDAQLVSAMYRTHKSLPSPNKVSSLYIFDAIARAMKSAAKHKPSRSASPSVESSASTFLRKIEGVLDDLYCDLASVTDFPEMKEKMKKVLDIWRKAGTFPSETLDRLQQITEGQQEAEQVTDVSVVKDPRRPATVGGSSTRINGKSHTSPVAQAAAASVTLQAGALPPALLALLGTTVSGSTAVSALPSPIAIPSAPTQTSGAAVFSPTGVHTFNGQVTSAFDVRPVPNSRSSSPKRETESHQDPRSNYQNEGWSNGHIRDSERSYGRDARMSFDPRRAGRGREAWRGRQFDDRPRNRSRSPPGRYYNESTRNYPPRRPYERRDDPLPVYNERVLSASYTNEPQERTAPSAPTATTDEFGREIRASSVNDSTNDPSTTATTPRSPPTLYQPPPSATRTVSAVVDNPSTTVQTTSTTGPASFSPMNGIVPIPLSMFDFAACDFTQPMAWQALAASFALTWGYQPSQEELFTLIMTANANWIMSGAGGSLGPSIEQRATETSSNGEQATQVANPEESESSEKADNTAEPVIEPGTKSEIAHGLGAEASAGQQPESMEEQILAKIRAVEGTS